MNKEDLVSQVAKVVATKKEAEAVVDAVFGAITKALKE
jgi:nucleoid DNA-binding protein